MADVTPIAGELHTQVMSVVWRLDNATVEQVRSALPARYCGAYNTVQTVLNRLGGGGLLSRQKAGHAIEYRPRIPGSNSIRSPSPWPSRLSPSATSGSAVSRHQWVRDANTSVRGRKKSR